MKKRAYWKRVRDRALAEAHRCLEQAKEQRRFAEEFRAEGDFQVAGSADAAHYVANLDATRWQALAREVEVLAGLSMAPKVPMSQVVYELHDERE